MKFTYTSLTKNNKKITGVLEAIDKETAEADLHKMGLAIISVNAISEEEYEKIKNSQDAVKAEKGIRTFTFTATDDSGKDVEGTIDALDDFSAYRRLKTEYRFNIKDLYPVEAGDDEKLQMKSMLKDFEERLKHGIRQLKEDDKSDGQPEEDEEINKKLALEIDSMILNTKKILEANPGIFSGILLQNIKKTLGDLERVRTSNNIRHIEDLSNELFELISNPDQIEDEALSDTYQTAVDEIRNSALMKNELELYKRAIGISGLKKIFQKITGKLSAFTGGNDGKRAGRFGTLLNQLIAKFSKKNTGSAPEAQKSPSRLNVLFGKIITCFKKNKKMDSANREAVIAILALEANNRESTIDNQESKGGAAYIFNEINSFICWLFCFYIIYFFLAGFALEKNIGLDRDFVFKTFKSPLIINISIFLLFLHLSLRIRDSYFRRNIPASIFLFFLSFGIYAFLVVNF